MQPRHELEGSHPQTPTHRLESDHSDAYTILWSAKLVAAWQNLGQSSQVVRYEMPNPMLQTMDTPIYQALIERHRSRSESNCDFSHVYVQVVAAVQPDHRLANLPLHSYRIACST